MHTLYLGYWYQRTSLHLSEVYDFFRTGTSPLDLDKDKLLEMHAGLGLKHMEFMIDILEYIQIETENGIKIKYYEDGLVVLSKQFTHIETAKQQLLDYYDQQFAPAINYLFSLGAPVPKELSNIQLTYPYFLVTHNADRHTIDALLKELGEQEYFEFKKEHIEIYRGETNFVINSRKNFAGTERLIEMFIFFSEFKAQLHRYLNLHRAVWEKIEKIKEQGYISGKNIEKQRNELESYKKTIELIDGRMEQMGLYMGTRANIVKSSGWNDVLTKVLAFKYENLTHSLDYIKSLWKMTKRYVDAGIQIFNEINQSSTKNAVNALTIISSIGIVGVILAHVTRTDFPHVSLIGLFYLSLLFSIAFFINRFINFLFKSMKYKVNDIDYKKDLE